MTNSQATESGTLYIVATPIGNRDDISLRALSILKAVDLILAEDTRHSSQLLHSLGIKNRLESLHAHNEHDKSQLIIQQLLTGKSIALISDAGTPLISDPGFPLVKMAREYSITVTPIPGPCALITALSAAGVACDSFLFLGFLPAKSSARINKFNQLRLEPATLVFYESTHRIIDCLVDIEAVYGVDCQLVLAKELTKVYEQFQTGSVQTIKHWLLADPARIKGEFVLMIPARPVSNEKQADKELLTVLLQELSLKQAVSLASKLSKLPKNELYQMALSITQSS